MRKLLSAMLFMLVAVTSAYAASNNSSTHALYQSAGNTIAGNPNGSITIVEFFDYNCGYCRMMYPRLNKLIAQDHDLRVIYREYPILSDRSMLPAEAALAAQMQGKYLALHDAMMGAHQPLDQDEIMRLAAQKGINTTQLAKDIQSPAVAKQLQVNLALGQSMNLQGVPTFIVVRTTPPSAQQPMPVVGPSLDTLKQMIQQAKNS